MIAAFDAVITRAALVALASGDVLLADALLQFDPDDDGADACFAAPELAHRCAVARMTTEDARAQAAFEEARLLLGGAFAIAVGFDALASVLARPSLALDRLRRDTASMVAAVPPLALASPRRDPRC